MIPGKQFRCVLIPGILAALCWTPGTALAQPDPRYWRLDDIQAQFQAWEQAFPEIFHATTLGSSGEGEPIPAARISDHASQAEAEPRLLFHAAQHANECNGTGAVMRAMADLLTGYGFDPAVTARVNGLEIWFVPIVNVDGHRYVFSGAPHWADWRKTLRDNDGDEIVDFPGDGVDTNRNWDWFWEDCDDSNPDSQQYKGPYAWSEPEVVALRDFILAERPVIVVDYHSPVSIGWHNYIFWPWISQHGWGVSPDEPVARNVASEWAASTMTEVDGVFFNSIFAYDSLPKEQCWVYGKTGILTFLMEISEQCWWSGEIVDTIATRVAEGSTYLLDRTLAGPGITGVVTDATTGNPLVAEVRLEQMHSIHVGPRLTESRYGQYHRLTEASSYTVTVLREGYETQSREVFVGSGGWAMADFALAPILTGAAGDSGDPSIRGDWFRGRNPLRTGEHLRLQLPAGLPPARVALMDILGREMAELGRQLVSGRIHELEFPRELPAGIYLVVAVSAAQRQCRRVVLLP